MVKPFSPVAIDAARAAQVAYPAALASLTLAQFRQESSDGAHMPPRSNNPFGVKAVRGQPSVSVETTEFVHGVEVTVVAAFRAYASLEAAFLDHARLIATASPYAPARAALPNVGRYVELVAARYATDPKYAAKLLTIIHAGNLTQFDTPAAPVAPRATPVKAAIQTTVAAAPKAAPAVALVTAVAATGATVVASASGALPPHWTVNLAPLVDQVVVPLVSTVLLGLVTAYLPKLIGGISAWLGIKVTAAQSQVIENAMTNGINLAVQKLGVTLDANASVDVKNQAIAIALNYALPKVSGEMASIGMDPTTLGDRILARLPAVAAPPAPVAPAP